ncbi:hypothetical protein K461DRAFT_309061 [Myriangium duriaei CBS 260.36]|uniref:Ribosomal RNA-processing protein 17 n=1 Tax=Myriangium duriaei CBS 260.36 TaxID=1168546 RepID=A0A9P4JB75_9PEZI|nr:hypothetical protein K461DRAFT_309061 [Myriangium duriaei CBS 260.36]
MAPASKRRKVEPVAELTFDPAARQEYLTGFHKRKQQRIKHAQEAAQKREREEKVQQRKELRDQRKQDLERHVAEVNALLRKQAESDDDDGQDDEEVEGGGEGDSEWAGFDDIPAVDGTDEYVDEGKFTTVTIKELDDVRDFESESESEDVVAAQVVKDTPGQEQKQEKRQWSKKRPQSDKPRTKKKKFRYESKLERQASRKKQKMKSSSAAQARRAG